MCGIAGFVDHAAGAVQADVERQLDTIAHRGPDSRGTYSAGAAIIGQTRLAVLDPSGGDPPLTDESGDVGVVLNGEIYNFRALADELRLDGHRFASSCDTEVLAHLGESLSPRELAAACEGMFAFALWDSRTQSLVLGRDRMGKKPLYYWTDGSRLAFGSEVKAVLAHPAVPRRLDVSAVPLYLAFGAVPSPRTFYEGIRQVPPGHVLVMRRGAGVQVMPYWSLPVPTAAQRPDRSFAEAAVAVRAELDRAVQRRLVSDVPLGAFLSGGIDSSAVVGLMAQCTDEPIRTFTIGFDDSDGFDERPYARLVAERWKTDHTEFVVEPKAIDLIEELVWHHDGPFGDSSAIPTYLLSQLTREHVTVAMSGDGGDELFAGYERFLGGLAVGHWQRLPVVLRRAVEQGVGRLGGDRNTRSGKAKRFVERASLGLPDAFRQWIAYVPDEWVQFLVPGAGEEAAAQYDEVWRETEGRPTLDRLLHLNMRTYLLDDLLPKVDRMSMAHGLEVRSPFLDHRLVELAMSLAPSVKLRGRVLKRVLKAAVADVVPSEVLHRPKHGFGVPLARWFREDLDAYVRATLLAPRSAVSELLDVAAIERMVAEHARGSADHGHALWTLLTLEVFLRKERE